MCTILRLHDYRNEHGTVTGNFNGVEKSLEASAQFPSIWILSTFHLTFEDKLSSLTGVEFNGLSHLWADEEFVAVVSLLGVLKLSSLLLSAELCCNVVNNLAG